LRVAAGEGEVAFFNVINPTELDRPLRLPNCAPLPPVIVTLWFLM